MTCLTPKRLGRNSIRISLLNEVWKMKNVPEIVSIYLYKWWVMERMEWILLIQESSIWYICSLCPYVRKMMSNDAVFFSLNRMSWEVWVWVWEEAPSLRWPSFLYIRDRDRDRSETGQWYGSIHVHQTFVGNGKLE